ncbi:hypothetical protein LCGC14_1760060 [marine sediment metagenome]|uniref:Uncharacterized protein n=1 Tax=marine sediment metagenome TaxID=412755 RepID=A0A0F9JGF3_9ZZZZ
MTDTHKESREVLQVRLTDWSIDTIEITSTQLPLEQERPPTVEITEKQLNRLVIEEVLGVSAQAQKDTAEVKQLRQQVAKDIAGIKKAGGAVLIPPGIAGRDENDGR